MEINSDDISRFWSYVDKRGPVCGDQDSRCWEWQGGLSRSGYGRFSINAKDMKAHRFSYLLATGDEPEMVRHICGNRKCVRPNHLRAGGSEENLIDLFIDRWRAS